MQRWFAIAIVAMVACSAHDDVRPVAPVTTPRPLARLPSPLDAMSTPPPPPPIVAPGLRLPEGVTPLHYTLRLELDPDSDTFHGSVAIETQIDGGIDHVWVHADELEITAAAFHDGDSAAPLRLLDVRGDQMRGFAFDRVIEHRVVELDFEFIGHTLHDMEGLFRQRTGERWFLFSQGESVLTRRITPCFDEPRFKTPWQVTLVVPKDIRAFGNMPVAHEAVLPDGRHELALVETPPMPSYLLAVAAGPFAVVDAGTVGAAKVPVRVIVPPADRDHVKIVAAKVPQIVAALEAYTDLPFPWPKLDLVVVPNLFGAMENPGLVTFDAEIVVGDPHVRWFAAHFIGIAAHELAHQWFGNLVTPAWWDDLWLAEAFASWLAGRIEVKLGGVSDPAMRLALLSEDALVSDDRHARALRHPVLHNDEPDAHFDAIIYNKGEAVLATFEHWIGEDTFRTALRAYLRGHAHGTATTADLVAAITTASTPAAGEALAGYADHAGAPVVELSLACDGPPKVIAHVQDGLSVPVCVRYAGTRGAERTCMLAGDHSELALSAATTCPKWAYATERGYYHVVWTTNGARGPAPPLDRLAPAERVTVGADLAAATLRGELALPAALAQIRELAASRDPIVRRAAMSVAKAIDPIVDETTRDTWAAWLAVRFHDRLSPAALFSPEGGLRDDLLTMLGPDHLPPLVVRRARQRLSAITGRGLVPPQLLVAIGGGDAAAFDHVAKLLRSHDAESDAAAALASFGPAQARAALALVLGDLSTEVTWPILAEYFERVSTRSAAWLAVRDHLPELLAHLSGNQAVELVEATAGLCTAAAHIEVLAAFEPMLGKIPEGRHHLDEAVATIDRCVARRTAAGDLAAALANTP